MATLWVGCVLAAFAAGPGRAVAAAGMKAGAGTGSGSDDGAADGKGAAAKAPANGKPKTGQNPAGERGANLGPEPERRAVHPPESSVPAQPVTASAFGYPYLYTERFASSGDYPATAALKVADRAVTAYVQQGKGDDSYHARGVDVSTTSGRLAYGVTPVFHLKGGVRLGLGFDSEEFAAKNHAGGARGGPSKSGWDLTTVAVQGAYRSEGPWAAGLKYSTSRLRIFNDERGIGGIAQYDGERYADIRPSVALLRAAYEVQAEFLPRIQLAAGAAQLARPATTVVQYRQTLAPGRVALADAEWAAWSGMGSGLANALALRGGFVSSKAAWGDVGGTAGYRLKHYSEKTAADPASIGRLEGSLFADVRPDRETHYACEVQGAIGQDTGEAPSGATAEIKTQALRYQFSFARLF